MILRKPSSERVKVTLATVVIRSEFFKHVTYLIESAVRLLLLLFGVKRWFNFDPESGSLLAMQEYLTRISF
jgi:hypothetical protein